MERDSDVCLAVARAVARALGFGSIEKHHAPDHPSLTRRAAPGTKFIDLEATTSDGTTLALEHTTIESYENQRHDGRQLVKLLVPLEDLLVGSLPIDRAFLLNVRRGAIADRDLTAEQVRHDLVPWMIETAPRLPAGTPHTAPNHQAKSPSDGCLQAVLSAWPTSHPPGGGRLAVGRFSEDQDVLRDMRRARLRRSLDDKLPKLLAHPADRRVLVLEDVDIAESNVPDVTMALRAASEGLSLPNTIVVVETGGGLCLGTTVYDDGWMDDFTAHQLSLAAPGGAGHES